jgi:hypothetical protein
MGMPVVQTTTFPVEPNNKTACQYLQKGSAGCNIVLSMFAVIRYERQNLLMIFQHTTSIISTPEDIFRFFEEMEKNYTRWHPDHIRFEWAEGKGLKEGTICYFEETIAGEIKRQKVIYTKIIPNQQIEFTPVNRLNRIFLRKMTFEISDRGDHCELTARVVLKWVGPLAKKINEDTFDAMRKHMKEEGENLKRILEGKTDNKTQK